MLEQKIQEVIYCIESCQRILDIWLQDDERTIVETELYMYEYTLKTLKELRSVI